MKRKFIIKTVVSAVVALTLFFWLVLSPVLFFGKSNQACVRLSLDGSFKAVAYYISPTTPYGAYQRFINKDVFVVLYGKNAIYLGQSSPFHFSELEGIFGDAVFFPGELSGDESFSINGVDDYVDGYTIPSQYKKWWSTIVSIFH